MDFGFIMAGLLIFFFDFMLAIIALQALENLVRVQPMLFRYDRL